MDLSLCMFVFYLMLFTAFFFAANRWMNMNMFSRWQYAAMFWYKAGFACLYGWIHQWRYYGSDTWLYFKESEIAFSSLQVSIGHYLALVFGPNNMRPCPDFLAPYLRPMHFWYDYSNYFIVRIHTFLRLISGESYYTHALFFAALNLVAMLLLSVMIKRYHTGTAKWSLVLMVFFPSVAFWLSGAHKDGVSFVLAVFILYGLERYKNTTKKTGYLLLATVSLFLLFRLRNYFVPIVLSAPMFYLIWNWNLRGKKYYIGATVLLLGFISVLYHYLVPSWSIYTRLGTYQKLFTTMLSASKVYLPAIADPDSFISGIPVYFFNVFIAPAIPNTSHWLKVLSSLEGAVVLLLSVLICFLACRRILLLKPIMLSLFFMWFVHWSLLGMVVDNLGTIIRYRTVTLPFLLCIFAYLYNKELSSVRRAICRSQ